MIGQTISHYRITEQLGEGGMGIVYRADDLKLDRIVALKFLASRFVRDMDAKARFVHEAKAASALDHPNICTIHSIEETDDGQLFIVMPSYEGSTLKELISRGPLEIPEALDITLQVGQGLVKAHSLGIVHRDIKPANIFLTGDGHAKLLDFGIAKLAGRTQITQDGAMLGTVHYMSPEQIQAEEVDRRTDLWSLGVVLYEMLGGKLPFSGDHQQAVMYAILNTDPPPLLDARQDLPPQLELAVTKSLAKDLSDRYQGAEELLETIQPLAATGNARLARRTADGRNMMADSKDVRPYPGLASFSQKDAEFFHGRESQIEAVWQRLRQKRLVAVTGPSGVGKTSFMGAGLVPAKPEDWGVILTSPGASPFLSLREALVRVLAGDTDAMLAMVRGNDPDRDIATVRRWRRNHDEGLVVIDQFEELFTLNPPEEQVKFANFLSRMVIEADVHVLISLRDDFLYQCQQFAGLAPMFESVTVLGPLTGPALRRALVQPALDSGFGFEDETMIDEMMAEVESERGALPLLAFAMARLWERRDTEHGLLTRQAYEQIGAVSGALVQHAEAVMEQIGTERKAIVRELFRNLVSAQGTRAVRKRDQLLSVFPSSALKDAEEILGLLVDARLLTSYEAKGEDGSVHRRIEIVHESLLGAWPRLVRWRTQDADNAQIRDQLRQAAQLWEQRGRSKDLLWTGTAFKEFDLWRERYKAGLSDQEEEFAAAMKTQNQRRTRMRRTAVSTAFIALLAVLAVVGAFGKRADRMAKLSEARRFQMLAEDALEQDNTLALALATAGLQRDDNPELRHLALAALSKSPTRFDFPLPDSMTSIKIVVPMSPDGKWLATGDKQGVTLWPADGSGPLVLPRGETAVPYASSFTLFGSGNEHVFETSVPVDPNDRESPVLGTLWSIPDRKIVHVWKEEQLPFGAVPFLRGDPPRLLVARYDDPAKPWLWLSYTMDSDEPRILGRANTTTQGLREFEVDQNGRYLLDWKGHEVFLFPLDSLETASPLLVGRHDHPIKSVAIDSQGRQVASIDISGEIRVWTVGNNEEPDYRYQRRGPKLTRTPTFDATGNKLAVKTAGTPAEHKIYDLTQLGTAPLQLLPLRLQALRVSFTPDGSWGMAPGVSPDGVWFYPLVKSYPTVWPFCPDSLTAEVVMDEAGLTPRLILPGGKQMIASKGYGDFWICDLLSEVPNCRPLYRHPTKRYFYPPAADTLGRYILSGDIAAGKAFLIPLDGSPTRFLGGFDFSVPATALSPDARWAALGGFSNKLDPPSSLIRIWELETDEIQELVYDGSHEIQGLWFLPDRKVLASSKTGLRVWDLASGDFEILSEREHLNLGAFDSSKRFLVIDTPEGVTFWDLAERTERILPIPSPTMWNLDLAPDASFVVAGMDNGEVQFHSLETGEVHLLLGHEKAASEVRVMAGGDRIMSASFDGTVRLWDVPQGPPLHTRPHKELLEILLAQTNLRIVNDVDAENGFRVIQDHFPGWETAPTW